MGAKNQVLFMLAAAVAVAVAAYTLTRKGVAASAGAGAARAVVGAVDGFVGGVVVEGSALFGVPRTDAEKCAAAKAAGDTWGASLYCPAADFIGYATTRNVVPDDPYVVAAGTPWSTFDQEDADAGAALRGIAFAETTGGAVTGILRGR